MPREAPASIPASLASRMSAPAPAPLDPPRSRFRPWMAAGVAVVLAAAGAGLALLMAPGDGAAGSPFVVFLTDAPPEFDELHVGLQRVEARGAQLRVLVTEFDLAQHRGPAQAIAVAEGLATPEQRSEVRLVFSKVTAVKDGVRTSVELKERSLTVQYEAALDPSGAQVLFHIPLETAVTSQVRPDGSVGFAFEPSVSQVYVQPLAAASAAAEPGRGAGFAQALPMLPVKQYRGSGAAVTSVPSASSSAPLASDASAPAGSGGIGKVHVAANPATTAGAPTTAPLTTTPTTSQPPPSNVAPAKATVLAPGHGAVNRPASGALQWAGGADADGDSVQFRVFYSATATFTSSPLCSVDTATSASRSCGYSANFGQTRFWRVDVDDGEGHVTVGDVWSFTVESQHGEPEEECFAALDPSDLCQGYAT